MESLFFLFATMQVVVALKPGQIETGFRIVPVLPYSDAHCVIESFSFNATV